MKVVLSPHQGVVGSERSLKTALVSLFVEGVLEIEGDEKGNGCHGDYLIHCGCHGDYITHCGCWYLRSRLFVCVVVSWVPRMLLYVIPSYMVMACHQFNLLAIMDCKLLILYYVLVNQLCIPE